MAKATKRTFSVDAVVSVWTAVDISAESWDEAIEIAKTLSVTDFVKIPGSHNDSKLVLTGIHNNEGLSKLD